MKNKKPRKPDPLRTEAAIKKAVVLLRHGNASIRWKHQSYVFEILRGDGTVIAIADLRDLYRKRAPIRMKDLRKAIQPKRKRK